MNESRAHNTHGSRRPTLASTKSRIQPLPQVVPKSAQEDPTAPQRIAAILASASYRSADQDLAFLASDEVRGVRLQLDYQKAELLLARHGIEHTIVVFGSTRLTEPKTAAGKVAALKAALAAAPADPETARRLAVAERQYANSRYYDEARAFGKLVGAAWSSTAAGRVVVMTGGGPGIMEAANRGACDVGADTVGLNITLPHEQYPNPYVTPQLCFSFRYFAIRKLHFLKRARALVVFPGGFGTLDELFETLTLIQTRKMPAVPVILVGRSFWESVIDIDFLVAEGTIDPEDRDLIGYAESATEAWEIVCHWHASAGTPQFVAPGATP